MRKSEKQLLMDENVALRIQLRDLTKRINAIPEGCAKGGWCEACIYAEMHPVHYRGCYEPRYALICMKGACQHMVPINEDKGENENE